MELYDTLKDVTVGDIVYSDDGYAFICVPQDDAPYGKVLTDGDLEYCTDEDVDFDWIILPPDMYLKTLGAERLAFLKFVLYRREKQCSGYSSRLWNVINYVSLN